MTLPVDPEDNMDSRRQMIQQPLPNNSTTPDMTKSSSPSSFLTGLATDLSQLALTDQPPPRKVRRRNALTVQDLHYPPSASSENQFTQSTRMQCLDNVANAQFVMSKDDDMDSDFNWEHKRKVAGKKKKKKEALEISQISLHKDLESFKPKTTLPESLVRKYATAKLSSPCSALVLYQPRVDLVSQILGSINKDENNSSKTNNSSSKPSSSSSCDAMDMDEL